MVLSSVFSSCLHILFRLECFKWSVANISLLAKKNFEQVHEIQKKKKNPKDFFWGIMKVPCTNWNFSQKGLTGFQKLILVRVLMNP